MDVSRHPNNLPTLGISVVLIRTNVGDVFTNRVFIRKETPGQSLIDDGSAHATSAVAFVEITTSDYRYLHRPKVVSANTADTCRRLVAGLRCVASFNSKVTANVGTAKRHWRNECSVFGSRQCLQSSKSFIHILKTVLRFIV